MESFKLLMIRLWTKSSCKQPSYTILQVMDKRCQGMTVQSNLTHIRQSLCWLKLKTPLMHFSKSLLNMKQMTKQPSSKSKTCLKSIIEGKQLRKIKLDKRHWSQKKLCRDNLIRIRTNLPRLERWQWSDPKSQFSNRKKSNKRRELKLRMISLIMVLGIS